MPKTSSTPKHLSILTMTSAFLIILFIAWIGSHPFVAICCSVLAAAILNFCGMMRRKIVRTLAFGFLLCGSCISVTLFVPAKLKGCVTMNSERLCQAYGPSSLASVVNLLATLLAIMIFPLLLIWQRRTEW
jgi:hypothetical protein